VKSLPKKSLHIQLRSPQSRERARDRRSRAAPDYSNVFLSLALERFFETFRGIEDPPYILTSVETTCGPDSAVVVCEVRPYVWGWDA
jgi:hypothetical protein